jgi:hypothetical protein
MIETKVLLAVVVGASLAACGGSSGGGDPPGRPGDVSVVQGDTAGTAIVSFSPPASGPAPTGYIVTVSPGGITATGASSPITVHGLAPQTGYTYRVVAANAAGDSPAAVTGLLRFYSVVETFYEPETQPNDSIFVGWFTFDATSGTVSNLGGKLSESMTGGNVGYPNDTMTWVPLDHQLSSVPVSLEGVTGLLVTAFYLNATDTFDPSGFAPGGVQYYGHSAGAPNPSAGGVGNAYALIFVNTADPTTPLEAAQLDRLAYADCTAGGMMGPACMTGTTVAGYGVVGTMGGYPVSQVVTEQ